MAASAAGTALLGAPAIVRSQPAALKIGLLIMAALAFIAIIPAGSLPGYQPGEIPEPDEAARKT